MSFEYKQFYRRKLPHIHSPGSTLFVTFRLFGSIPRHLLKFWQKEKLRHAEELGRLKIIGEASAVSIDEHTLNFHRQWFKRFEDALHGEETGETWLKDERVASLVADSLRYRDGRVYHLKAFCIISNHVHVVFRPFLNDRCLSEVVGSGRLGFVSSQPTLGMIMQSLKGYTAHECNKILGRTGQFWDEESYDHEVRNEEELGRIVCYVLNNPVKAELVKHWRDWKWSWCAE